MHLDDDFFFPLYAINFYGVTFPFYTLHERK
jgi:hypothetical protein